MSRLIDHLPEYYKNSPEMVAIQDAIQPEVDRIKTRRDDMLLQLSPYTATWGLTLWETALGLASEPDKSIEFRRVRVISHLRGNGPTTAAMVKNVAESFSNGEVELNESPSESRVEILLLSDVGIPPNMDDLKDALAQIMPAHIEWRIVYTLRTYQELMGYTYGQLAQYTYATLREGSLT